MKFRELALIAVFAGGTLAVASCGTLSSVVSAIQNNGAADAAAAEVALTAAENLAVLYEKEPTADPAVVLKIKAADTTAYDAVMTAKNTLASGDVQAALAAISAFQSLLPQGK